jgi:capsular exopolysaccharide synthesis family protein
MNEPNPPPVGAYGQPPEYPGSPPQSRWQRYGSFARQLWWVPLLTLAFAVCGAAAYLLTRPPAYLSEARLWVSGKLQIPEGSLYSEELQFFFGTQVELMQSEKIRQRALARVQTLHPEQAWTPVKLKITQAPKSAVFVLQAVGADPAFTQRYLNALIDEYLAYKKEVRASSSDDTLASLAQQLYEHEKELKAEQEKLAAFQRDNNLAVLQEQSSAAGAYLAKLNAQLSDLRLEYQLLDAAGPDEPGSEPTPPFAATSRAPAELLAARQQLQMLQMQREELSRFLRPKHPKIQRLDEEIARGQKVIANYREQSREQLAATRQTLKLKLEGLQASIKEWETRLTQANGRIAEFERLKTSVERVRSLYERLLNLLQTVDVNKNLDQEIVSVMQRAGAAERVRTPQPQMLGLAAAAGLSAGLGLIFLVARFDDRLTSLNEVLEQFEEEIVGQVPDVAKTRNNGTLKLVEPDDARHMFAESYRNLRSSLLFMPSDGRRPKTVLITSAVPNEGKSTIAANLARTLAFAGARVLLIDADLRRGRLHELLGVQRGAGLARLLRERGRLNDFSVPTELPNLAFLPCGEAVGDASELFLSTCFDELLQEAHARFDHVIVDSPPVFAADDAPTMAPKMDGVLFVVRGGYTRVRVARRALDVLYQRQTRLLGLVFNRANTRSASYYYYKYAEYYHAPKRERSGPKKSFVKPSRPNGLPAKP